MSDLGNYSIVPKGQPARKPPVYVPSESSPPPEGKKKVEPDVPPMDLNQPVSDPEVIQVIPAIDPKPVAVKFENNDEYERKRQAEVDNFEKRMLERVATSIERQVATVRSQLIPVAQAPAKTPEELIMLAMNDPNTNYEKKLELSQQLIRVALSEKYSDVTNALLDIIADIEKAPSGNHKIILEKSDGTYNVTLFTRKDVVTNSGSDATDTCFLSENGRMIAEV